MAGARGCSASGVGARLSHVGVTRLPGLNQGCMALPLLVLASLKIIRGQVALLRSPWCFSDPVGSSVWKELRKACPTAFVSIHMGLHLRIKGYP